jgi:hypothetical protein
MFVILFVVLIIVLSACGGGAAETTESPQPTESEPQEQNPPADQGEQPGGGPPAGQAEIVFHNTTTMPLCEAFVTFASQPDWSRPNITDTIPPDSTHTLTDVPPGTYDIKVHDCDGFVVAWALGVELADGDSLSYTVVSPVDYLEIENGSSLAVCGIYVKTPDLNTYSRDMLSPRQQIAPGETFFINLARGAWDLRFESCSGAVIEENNYRINGETTFTIHD